MNEQILSKRLERVGSYVAPNARLADIGSDHAYLPVALMLQNKLSYAVAGEVVKGPYESACKQVKKNGLQDRITVRLANGLAAVQEEDQIDTVTIAGMGGTLIASILESGMKENHLRGTEKLILQPNIGEANVRIWLAANGYELIHEEIIEENGKLYEILVADPATIKMEYSFKELQFGPYLMKEKSAIFIKKWQQELEQKYRVLEQLEKATSRQEDKVALLNQEIDIIKELLL